MREFDFEKFKRDNRRNLIILDKVFEIMKPIFKVTNSVEISVSEDGHPQLRFTHCPTKRAVDALDSCDNIRHYIKGDDPSICSCGKIVRR